MCVTLHTEASEIMIQRNILVHTDSYPTILKKKALYSFPPTRVPVLYPVKPQGCPYVANFFPYRSQFFYLVPCISFFALSTCYFILCLDLIWFVSPHTGSANVLRSRTFSSIHPLRPCFIFEHVKKRRLLFDHACLVCIWLDFSFTED